MKELAEKYMDVLEKLDWSVRGYYEDSNGETHVEIENWSPAGEDLPIDLHTENFPDSVAEYAACFDVDEHVELWIEGRDKEAFPARPASLWRTRKQSTRCFATWPMPCGNASRKNCTSSTAARTAQFSLTGMKPLGSTAILHSERTAVRSWNVGTAKEVPDSLISMLSSRKI